MNCFNLFLILVVSGTYTHLRRAVIKGPNTYVIYDHLELGKWVKESNLECAEVT